MAADAAALIRHKREGQCLDARQVQAIANGIADGSWCDAQIAAFAMSVAWRGMDAGETRALTLALLSHAACSRAPSLSPAGDIPAPRHDVAAPSRTAAFFAVLHDVAL